MNLYKKKSNNTGFNNSKMIDDNSRVRPINLIFGIINEQPNSNF